jgi:hypothetical protein
MGDSGYWYQFGTGIGEEELNRLEVQGAGIAPATRSVSSRSGKRASRRASATAFHPAIVSGVRFRGTSLCGSGMSSSG